jgi:hypothetical protein
MTRASGSRPAPPPLSPSRASLLCWTARVGATTADAVAHVDGVSIASARARLGRLTHERLLNRRRLLVDEPALYVITRAGLRRAELPDVEPCRVSAATTAHTIACARAAAALQRCYPDHTIIGERELRRRELCSARRLASVELTSGAERRLHRPDLVLLPPGAGPAVAVEIELTVKAPRRLLEICRAWQRASEVAGVVYLAPAKVRRALDRAIADVGGQRIVVVALESLLPIEHAASISRSIPSDPYVAGRGSNIEQTETTCPVSRSTE